MTRIYLDQYPITAARQLLFEGMNLGTGWVNYVGHGGSLRPELASIHLRLTIWTP